MQRIPSAKLLVFVVCVISSLAGLCYSLSNSESDPCSLLNACLEPARCPILRETAPAQFIVSYGVGNSSSGVEGQEIQVEVFREWAPRAVDRLWHLATLGYSRNGAYYRVAANATGGFVAQFGQNGDPAVDACWLANMTIMEEGLSPVASIGNSEYTVAFSMGSTNHATSNCNATEVSLGYACGLGYSNEVFINLMDNRRLDRMGFMPVGVVRSSASRRAAQDLYRGYGEVAELCVGSNPRPFCLYGAGGEPLGVNLTTYSSQGNAYIRKSFPRVSVITSMSARHTVPDVQQSNAAVREY